MRTRTTRTTLVPKRGKHQLIADQQGGQRCVVCGVVYRSRPTSLCPMAKRYAYGCWPEELMTYTQLRRQKLAPGGPPKGFYQRRKEPYWIYLYDRSEAIPRRVLTPAQRVGVKKMRAALIAKHTCKECGYFDERYGHARYGRISRDGYCRSCQVVIEHQPVRDQVQRWAFEYLEAGEFVVLDSETTGLFGDHEVIELALVHCSGEVVFSSLIQTQEKRWPGDLAEHIHGISQEMLETAPRFPEVWPQVEAILCRYPRVLVYNAAFDSQMLQQTAARYNIEMPTCEWECLMESYARWWGAWSDYHWSYTWQKLGVAYRQLTGQFYTGQAHRATADCLQALTVLKELAARTSPEKIAEVKEREQAAREAERMQWEEEKERWRELYGEDEHPF